MNDELKPVRCGCGGEAKVYNCVPNFAWYAVKCKKCGTETSSYHTEAEAIEAWNKAMGAKDINVRDKIIYCKDCVENTIQRLCDLCGKYERHDGVKCGSCNLDSFIRVLDDISSQVTVQDCAKNARCTERKKGGDFISRQALCDDLREYKVDPVPVSSDELEVKGYNDGIDLAISVIAEFPSAEPERKTGKWIEYPDCLQYDGAYSDDQIVCSECHHVFNILDNCTEEFDFCPHCGADMREANDENA